LEKLKDARYDIIKVLIAAGKITSISDIFVYIPKTIVYQDLGINFNRFVRAITDPAIFKLGELRKLAEMFGVDAKKIVDMAYEQSLTLKSSKSQNKQA
jgi:hypothetical protein